MLEGLRVIIPEFRATPESRVEAPAEGFDVPLAQPLRTPTHHRCPRCESFNIHRSHIRSLSERVKKGWSHRRPYSCHDCDWRGWLVPLTEVQTEGLADTGDRLVDLTSIDAAVRDQTKPTRPAFSPRNLS